MHLFDTFKLKQNAKVMFKKVVEGSSNSKHLYVFWFNEHLGLGKYLQSSRESLSRQWSVT